MARSCDALGDGNVPRQFSGLMACAALLASSLKGNEVVLDDMMMMILRVEEVSFRDAS